MQIIIINSTIITQTTQTNETQNVDDVDVYREPPSPLRPIITVNNKNKHSVAIILRNKNVYTENND